MSKNVFKSSAEATSLQQPRAFDTIVYGGLVAGILDMLIRLHFLRPILAAWFEMDQDAKRDWINIPHTKQVTAEARLFLKSHQRKVGGLFKSDLF